ncbi:unnamed protein product [Mytilus coruscus]|uniref:Reverse transcriptase RNase H-like domain-containing protein n=1 Tax=Mytilus coruscus TaxID=42192 RepID=A0A6J8DYJ0_MYTCO|nr:unnamed protein product [Mytilus coruscus]
MDLGSLTWLYNFKEPDGQIMGWIQKLSTYDFKIVYRSGSKHVSADALSRIVVQNKDFCKQEENIEIPTTDTDVHCGQTTKFWISRWDLLGIKNAMSFVYWEDRPTYSRCRICDLCKIQLQDIKASIGLGKEPKCVHLTGKKRGKELLIMSKKRRTQSIRNDTSLNLMLREVDLKEFKNKM